MPVPPVMPGMPVPMFYPPHSAPVMAQIIAPANANVNVPMNPDSTGYFGNLSPNVSDEVLSAVLGCSGGFKRLKRPVDPSNGKAKPFALVEFESVTDLWRAFRLLQDFPLDGRHFNIKIESGAPVVGNESDHSEDLKCYEGIQKVLIGKRLTGSSSGSMEWLEKKISQLKRIDTVTMTVNKDTTANVKRDPRQRNYSDLLVEETSSAIEASNAKMSESSKTDALMALKDRERRWESLARDLEREFRRDLQKDEERSRRHAKDAALLAEQVSTFSDCAVDSGVFRGSLDAGINSNATNLFFSDREKWRAMRKKAVEREEEIFRECIEIQRNLTANAAAKQREMIEKTIPVQKEELFGYLVDFEKVNLKQFRQLCRERACAFFAQSNSVEMCEKLGEFVYEKICKERCSALNLIAELNYEPLYLAVSSEIGQAEVFVLIIWRWLIYCTLCE